MDITSPSQITGAVARQLRVERKMRQTDFWAPVGVPNKSMASSYERELHRISEPVQMLIYMHHVCRIPVGQPHEIMLRLGAVTSSVKNGMEALGQAAAIAEIAVDALKSAQACMRDD